MAYFEVCPKCGSDDVLGNRKRESAHCNHCGYASAPEKLSDFVPPAPLDLVQRCHSLAHSPAWLDAVLEHWPTPIAHEYQRLRELLGAAQPDVTGAVWQLKDVAEVLLKFPALVLYRDLCCNEPAQVGAAIKRQLLAKPLSMGDWHALGLNLSERVLQSQNPQLLSVGVASLFRDARGRPTVLMNLLQRMVRWRNDEIAHGAFRIDAQELVQSLEDWIGQLNAAWAAHVSVWGALSLVRRDADPSDPARLLMGCAALHTHSHAQATAGRLEALCLETAPERSLLLSPYVSLRLCAECVHHDVFFFDSYKGRDRRAFYLDYFRGHKMSLAGHMDRDLHQDVAMLPDADASTDVPDSLVDTDPGYLRGSVFNLLQAQQLKASLLSPEYLHQPLEAFMASHNKGIFWLKAQGHVGKTLFTQDVLQRNAKRQALCCAFYIKREYNAYPVQFATALGTALCSDDVLDLTARTKALPELASDISPDQAPAAFVDWITALRRISGKRDQSLVVCIDGLDELPDGANQLSIAHYLPDAAQLPVGVYLLLTSRPASDCPTWLNSWLQSRLHDGPHMQTMLVDPASNQSYHALMRTYFYSHLDVQWKHDVHQAMAYAAAPSGLQQPAPEMPESMQAFAKKQLSPGAREVNWAVVNPVFADFESCFHSLLEKAEYRFLFFSYLVDTLATLAEWKVIEGLPSGKQMFAHFIAQLELQLSDKLHALAMRVLLTLAAAEEVDAHQRSWHLVSPPWTGLPLGLLAALLNDSESAADGSAISDRLVFVLYTLKTVLASYKADATLDSRFSLGLKGLGPALRELKARELDQVHAQLAGQFMDEWSGNFDAIPDADISAQYLLGTALGHTDLSQDAVLQARLAADIGLGNGGWLTKANHALGRNDLAQALLWLERLIEMQRRVLLAGSTTVDMDLLALTYFRNRREQAKLYAGQGKVQAALAALGKLQHDIRRDMASSTALTYEIFKEFLLTEEQRGWLLLDHMQDAEAAMPHFETCFQSCIGNLRLDMPLQQYLELTAMNMRFELRLAQCYRAQKRSAQWQFHINAATLACSQFQQAGPMPTQMAMVQTQLVLEIDRVALEDGEGGRLEGLQAALASMRAVPAEQQQGDYQIAVVELLSRMAFIYSSRNDDQEACARCAAEAVQRLRPLCAQNAALQVQMAQALVLLDSAQAALGEKTLARDAGNEARAIYSQIKGKPAEADMTPRLEQTLAVVAQNSAALERREALRPGGVGLDEAYGAAEALDLEESPAEGMAAWQVVRTCLDRYLADIGDGDGNEKAPNRTQLDWLSAVCHMKTGIALHYLQRVPSARQSFGEAVQLFLPLQTWAQAKERDIPDNLATSLQWLAYLDECEGRYPEAIAQYLHSLEVMAAAIEAGHFEDFEVFTLGLKKSVWWAVQLEREPDLRAILVNLQASITGAQLQTQWIQSEVANLVFYVGAVLADGPQVLRLALQQQPGAVLPTLLADLGLA
ncbi:MAG: hypothetical protein H7293_05195 [Candidatus Saccharibacteria bacterium]|nr:hypothetical protein [Rhodoferax sp.]